MNELLNAIEKNDKLTVVQLLQEGSSPNGLYEGAQRPLELAIQLHHLEIVDLLLNYKACPTVGFFEHFIHLNETEQASIKKQLKQNELHTQTWILSKLKYLYSSPMVMCCNGFIYMGLNAILSEEVELFSSRMKYLYETSYRSFKKDMKNKGINITHDMLSSIEPFYQGLMLSYQPLFFSELLDETTKNKLSNNNKVPQLAQPLLNVIASKKIEEQGGYHLSCRFTGSYQTKDMIIYLQTLQHVLRDISCPIGILIRSEGHSILIRINHNEKTWELIDVGEIPVIKKIKETEVMAKKVIFNLEKDEKILAGITEVYCTKNNCRIVDETVKAWLSYPDMQQLHLLTKEKMLRKTSDGVAWFDIVPYGGDSTLVKMMIDESSEKLYKAGLIILLACLSGMLTNQKNISSSGIIISMFTLLIPIVMYLAVSKYRANCNNNKLDYAKTITEFNPPSIYYNYTLFGKPPSIQQHQMQGSNLCQPVSSYRQE